MKMIGIIILGICLLVTCIGCKNKIEDIYGIYTFEKVIYLSPFSSTSINGENEMMKGMEFTIKKDRFIAGTKFNLYDLPSPVYRREKITEGTASFLKNIVEIGNEMKYQYTIYLNSGSPTYYRLYVSSENVWLASYAEPSSGESDIIMYIFKLSKKQNS